MTHEEKAREIALWLYGPDEGMSEGLVRTLIDKIANEKKGRSMMCEHKERDENSDLKRRVAEYEQRGDGRSAFTNKVVDLCKDMAVALRFYADPQSYGLHGGSCNRVISDCGKQAKQALEKFKEVMK